MLLMRLSLFFASISFQLRAEARDGRDVDLVGQPDGEVRSDYRCHYT
jgi:hypothetical protein